MASPELHPFLVPLVHGFVSITAGLELNGHRLDLILISRRATARAGTRLHRRGADEQGAVANYVETEQIVQTGRYHLSFVQIRGSIPLVWRQTPNTRYKPRVWLHPTADHAGIAHRHFAEQTRLYGAVVAVSLINADGGHHEQPLAEAYARTMAALRVPRVGFAPFDFHRQCAKMRWDRLKLLYDRLAPDLKEHGWFIAKREDDVVRVLRVQRGVIRNNCIDCLDRTNVVQTGLARRALEGQLQSLGLLGRTTAKTDEHFDRVFRNVWADNADMLAVQYGGSPALKTDFTRTGVRSRQGALLDGWYAMQRYFRNNFADGRRQDGLDLALGHYTVDPGQRITAASPFVHARFGAVTAVGHPAPAPLRVGTKAHHFSAGCGRHCPRGGGRHRKYHAWVADRPGGADADTAVRRALLCHGCGLARRLRRPATSERSVPHTWRIARRAFKLQLGRGRRNQRAARRCGKVGGCELTA